MRENSFPAKFPLKIPPAGPGFGLFVFWLLAVPMEGPLLAHVPGDRHLFWFLVPHVLSLPVIGRFWPRAAFGRASRSALVVTILATIALGLLPAWQGPLLALCGVTAAFVSIRAGVLLRQSPRPLLAAAWGLVLGNLLLLLLVRLDLDPRLGSLLAAMALGGLLLPVAATGAGSLAGLYRYLPAVFVFQLVSGLMYSALLTAYAGQAFWTGSELAFYLVAVLLAVPLFRRDRELLLVAGVVFGLGAFLCLAGGGAWAVNLAMFGMQAAAGCVDMFLLAIMLRCADPQRAFGLGNAVLCAGILAGAGFNRLFGEVVGPALILSQLALNGAVLLLYWQHRRETAGSAGAPAPARLSPRLAPGVQVLLSPKECQVLELVVAGRTYRDIAAALEISESSVKTYMNRICGKFGATSKKDLLVKLSREDEALASSPP